MSATTQRGSRRLRRSLATCGAIGITALSLTGSLVTPGMAVASAAGRPELGTPATSAATSAAATPAAAGSASAVQAGNARCLRQFERAVQTYLDSTHSRDVKSYQKLLAPGYTIVLPGGTVFAGRRPAEAFIARFFARTDWSQTFQQTSQSVDGCRTGLVVFDSVYTDEDGPVPLVIALTWTYRGGHWQLLTDQNTVKDS